MADEKDEAESAEEVIESMADEDVDADDEAEDAEASDEDADEIEVEQGDGDEDSGESDDADTDEESDAEADGGESSDDASNEGEPSDEDEADAAEGSDDGAGAEELVDQLAESDKLEDVSKDKIKEALADVAGDSDDVAGAVAALADGEDDQASAEAEEGESTEDETSEESETEEEPEEAADASESEEADEEQEEREEEPAAADEQVQPEARPTAQEGTVGGVFNPEKAAEEEAAGYPDEDQFEGYESDESYTGILLAGGAAVVVLAVALIVLFGFTKQGERLVHLFKGDLKEYELAESKKKQAALREKQRDVIDKTPKIGTLKMRGKPQYSLIRVDGKIQYGKPEGSEYWKRMRLTPKTSFPVFHVEKDHKVSISTPGHKTREVDLALGNWTPVDDSVPDLQDAALKYNNKITVTLVPESRARELEFHKRMAKDPENNYFGEVTIETKPEGAKIIFDGAPLRNEKGEKLTTPVTFEKYYLEKEDSEELKEKKVKVDMPPDRGHKIQLEVPDAKGDYPKFVSGLQRQMWTCNWKDGEVPDNPSPEHCNYTFKLNVDFDKMKSFIENRKKKRKEIKSAWKDAQSEIDSIVEKANKKAGVKPKGKKRKAESSETSSK